MSPFAQVAQLRTTAYGRPLALIKVPKAKANTAHAKRTLAGQYPNGVGYYPSDDEVRVGDRHYLFNVADVLDALPQVVWAVHRAGTAVM